MQCDRKKSPIVNKPFLLTLLLAGNYRTEKVIINKNLG